MWPSGSRGRGAAPAASRAMPWHQSAPLEIELTRRSIPFVKFGGLKFLEAPLKDVLAFLRCVENLRFPRDPASWHAPSRYRRERSFVA